MKSVTALHRQAMSLADTAQAARLRRKESVALRLYDRAFRLERRAANAFKHRRVEPTRSVLYRSAACLALDCGKRREAQHLCATGLQGRPPEEIREELQDLLLEAMRVDIKQAYALARWQLRGVPKAHPETVVQNCLAAFFEAAQRFGRTFLDLPQEVLSRCGLLRREA